MRLPTVLLLFPAVVLISQVGMRAQTVQGAPADVEAIDRIIQGHAIGWNKGDAKMVARLWHEDGDIRTSSGTGSDTGIVKGREAIQARYEKMFAGWAKGTVVTKVNGEWGIAELR